MKTIQCRAHGGVFKITPKRGRPPTQCKDDNPCTRAGDIPGLPGVSKAAAKVMSDQQAPPRPAPAKQRQNGSKPSADVQGALSAKTTLEELGWATSAQKDGSAVMFRATRGTELLTIRFEDGKAEQWYSLWDTKRPQENRDPSMPEPRLRGLNLDEMTDQEVARTLSGRPVQWWNRISKRPESATVSAEKVQVQHTFHKGTADEVPADRVVTFMDYTGSGMRSFRLGALLRVD